MKMIEVMGLRIPSNLEDKYQLEQYIPADQRPVVFISPYEHHSNEVYALSLAINFVQQYENLREKKNL